MQVSVIKSILSNPFSGLSEEDMIKKVSEKTGLNFIKIPATEWLNHDYYEAKKKGIRYTCRYSYYYSNKSKFISVGYYAKNSGGGSPCNSLDEAINTINAWIEKFK